MEFLGFVEKKGSYWLIELSSLDLMTQGKNKTDALNMMEDLILEHIEEHFGKEKRKNFKITSYSSKGDNTFRLSSNDNKLLLSLLLRRQRNKKGLSIRDVAKMLGSKSPNSYAPYERGKISTDKCEELINVVNPEACVLTIE